MMPLSNVMNVSSDVASPGKKQKVLSSFDAPKASDNKAYLEAQGVEAALSDAVATIIREKPANALARIADILAAKAGTAVLPPATSDYLSTIGNTPMVQLRKMLPTGCKAKVFVKLEMQNPGGSLKDRIAKNMLEEAEAAGKLKSGMTVVEGTSGNTGIGLAMACAAKGYKCIIMMPQTPAMFERYIVARQFGAEVILTAPAKGFAGLLGAFNELIKSDPDKYFGANQFYNEDNPATHYATTGPEIWAQTGGEVDYLVHGVGTGATIAGAGKFLKEQKPSVKTVAIEPSNSRVHMGETPSGPHSIVGIGAGVKTNFLGATEGAPFVDPSVVDEWAHASSDEAIEYAAKACQQEGMMVGPSAGAALKVACELAVREECAGKTIVVMQASHGIRYVNHPMWAAVKKEATLALPSPPNMDKECG